MKKALSLSLIILCVACAGMKQSAIPLGNDMAEIDTSGAGRRADMEQAVMQKAAQTTIELGYDKFIVVKNENWEDIVTHGLHTAARPESKLTIHMYHEGEKGSEKALNARSLINPTDS